MLVDSSPVKFGRKSRVQNVESTTELTSMELEQLAASAAAEDADAEPEDGLAAQESSALRGAAPGGARRTGSLFGGTYSSVQTLDEDGAEPLAGGSSASLVSTMMARAGLIDEDGTARPERICRAFVIVFATSALLSLAAVQSSSSPAMQTPVPLAASGSNMTKLSDAFAPPPPPLHYVAHHGYTCDLDDSVENGLVEVGLAPTKTSSAGVPCWSEASTLSVVKATTLCFFVAEEVPDDHGGICVTRVRFCKEPLIGLAEADQTQ
eukprot:2810014-Prymnesium_polylepis.1